MGASGTSSPEYILGKQIAADEAKEGEERERGGKNDGAVSGFISAFCSVIPFPINLLLIN